MTRAIALILLTFLTTHASAAGLSDTDTPELDPIGPVQAVDVNLNDFLWIKRPVVVFADSAADPRYQEQMELLLERLDTLSERDVVIITDTDPAGRSEIRIKLRPRGFMLAVIGKDGEVKLRKPAPWDVRELTRVIDKMPLRQREIRDALRAQP